jgi:hypothetical protein
MRRLDHVVLNIAANAMLRTKKRCQIDIGMLVENIRDMPECFRQHGCLIANKADAQATKRRDLFGKEYFDAQAGPNGIFHKYYCNRLWNGQS